MPGDAVQCRSTDAADEQDRRGLHVTVEQKLMTADDLLRFCAGGMNWSGESCARCLLRVSTTAKNSRIFSFSRDHVRSNDLGRVLSGDTGFRLEDQHRTRSGRWMWRSCGATGFRRGERSASYSGAAPDPAAEVAPPNDLYTEADEKVAEWLEHGTRLVFVGTRAARDRRGPPGRRLRARLTIEDALDGVDVVPGRTFLPATSSAAVDRAPSPTDSGQRVPGHRRRPRGAASPRSGRAARRACRGPRRGRRPARRSGRRAAGRRAAVGDGQERSRRVARRGRVPELQLGLDVERARQVVDDQQLRLAHQHPRGGRPLELPARELDAARPDQRVEPVLERRQVAARAPRPQMARSSRPSRSAGPSGRCRAASR